MDWLLELFLGDGVAHSILLFALIIAVGLALGKIEIKGISLGVTFVLFVGILAGHFGLKVHPEVLHFMKEFGLIMFVYSIGLQVGPGFFSTFKKGGLQLNILAVAVVLLGVATTVVIHYITKIPMQTMVGIMSGAVTNTPGLGAAQDTHFNAVGEADPTIAMGYAITYPLAVLGIIGTLVFLRYIFKVDLTEESKKLKRQSGGDKDSVALLSLVVKNPEIFNLEIKKVAAMIGGKFIVSRILHKDSEKVEIANNKTILAEGDRIYVVTSPDNEKRITEFVGEAVDMIQDDWDVLDRQLLSKRVVVTHSDVNGKSLEELNFRANFGVNITRINRAGVDLLAQPDLQLQFGDRVTVVGDEVSIDNAIKVLGNKLRLLHEPHLIPIFLGILLGVLLGSIPFMFPGIPQPVKLGLAGGPLIVAILMSILGTKYKLITYTTVSANLMLREIGICFFLACVGLGAGEGFVDTIIYGGGLKWVGYGVIITVLPVLVVGLFAKAVLKVNYLTLMGMLAGSMTDPPALAYAGSVSDSDAAAVGYASVYPLTMFMRVLAAQMLILFFL